MAPPPAAEVPAVLPTAPEPQSDRFVLPSSPQAPATHAAAAHTAGPSTAAEQNLALLFQAAEQAQSAQSVAGAVEPTQQALAPQGSPAEATSNLPAALTSVTLVPTLPLPGSTAHAGQAAQLEAMHRHLQQQLQTQQEVAACVSALSLFAHARGGGTAGMAGCERPQDDAVAAACTRGGAHCQTACLGARKVHSAR